MKKFISFMLAVTMILSMMIIAPLSVSANSLDMDKIYVKMENKYYQVQTGDVITYRYNILYTTERIAALDVRVPYDSDALEILPVYDEYGDVDLDTMFPKTGFATVYNFNIKDEILFNYSNLNGIRLREGDCTVFVADFKVTATEPGVYEINGYVETLADKNNTPIVKFGETLIQYEEEVSVDDREYIIIDEDVPTEETEEQTAEPSPEWTGSGPSEPFDPPTPEPTSDETPEPEPIVPTGPGGTAPPPSPEPTSDETPEPEPIVPTGPDGTAPPPSQEPTYEGIYVSLDGELLQVQPGDVVTYSYALGYAGVNRISALDVHVYYDADALKFVPVFDEYGDADASVMFPATEFSTVYNYKIAGQIYFNYANTRGIRLKTDTPVFVGQFKVNTDKPGVYNIGSSVETLADSEMNKIVFLGVVYEEYEEEELILDVVPGPYPEPTPEPTEEETPEPTPEETPVPTPEPTEEETPEPTPAQTPEPTPIPTPEPTPEQTPQPTDAPATDDEKIPATPGTSTEEPTLPPGGDLSAEPDPLPTEPTEEEPDDPISPPATEEGGEGEPSQPDILDKLIGDVDGNGKVEVFDATLIQRFIAQFDEFADEQFVLGDTDFNGKIEVFDATIIQRFIAQFISEIKPTT